MRAIYVLLSPTFGMHQYTADLANRQLVAGAVVHLVTTKHCPKGRYAPGVSIHTPVTTTDTGFSLKGLCFWDLRGVQRAIMDLQPDLVHITGPHLWNPLLLLAIRRTGVPTVHTIHDLHPHTGSTYGRLLYLWNRWVRCTAVHLLVHGRRYRQELLDLGIPSSRVTYAPLTHLFMSHTQERLLNECMPPIQHEPWALFLGRLEIYKGLNVLVEAAGRLNMDGTRVVIAGPGELDRLGLGSLSANIELRNRLISDEEAIDLFCHCSLIVLPYVEASQSALIAAAYFFRKPVVVTDVGALPEYVVQGETGWVIAPQDSQALAEVLRTALNDRPRLVRLGRAGREWYERQRQAETAALQEMYENLQSGKPLGIP